MDRKSVEHTLNTIRDIKGSCEFYDIHCHPFEVMDGAINYDFPSRCNGLFSSVSSEYTVPTLSELNLNKQQKPSFKGRDKSILDKMLQLNRRRLYAHNGPKVFSDGMKLSGVDRVVLLPVVIDSQAANQQLQLLSDMFGGDERFLFGYCPPNDVPINEVSGDIGQVVNQSNVQVLKVHPSFQGVDLSVAEGKDRLEAILDASKAHSLKVVIHSGLSPACKNPDAIAYSEVTNLQQIDWSITPETVVLAHSASYGYCPEVVRKDILPHLDKLLSCYANLMIDTSALEVESLTHVFKAIDTDRVCFGSDSLYEKQWAEMIKLWCALHRSVNDPEGAFLEVASENPGRLFFSEEVSSSQIKPNLKSGEG
jgi:hypothetical protein